MERWRVSSRGDTSLFKPYLYVPLQRVGFCAVSAHFGRFGIRYGFRSKDLREHIYRFNSNRLRKKESMRIK